METEIKKEQVKKILASIQDSAFSLIDIGITKHPMDIVMELTITAYELDLFTDFVNKSIENSSQNLPSNVIKLVPKETN